jgi:hypothetical protein
MDGGGKMSAKRILAGIFAVLVLLKLIILAVNPQVWAGAVQALLGHQALVTLIYLILAAITGYYVFSTLDLLDIAVVMFFTGLLIGLSFIPYAGALPKLQEEVIHIGLGQAWWVAVLWGALAVAVLYKIFAPSRDQQRQK